MKINKLAYFVGLSFAVNGLPSAWAQQQQSEKDVEVIQVTGTHLKGVDMEGSQPLTILDAEAIARSGATSISELMRTLGQTRGGNGTFSTTESGATSTSTPAGQAAASLRGMGPASTLTLINGRRIAASSFAAGTQNFVDINSIPLSAIERVEVLATGASATYGADAVAGVINYILKDDFEGAEISASYGDSTADTDESKVNLNLLWGADIGGGHLTLFADLYRRNAFKATDRSYTQDPLLASSYSYLPKNTPNIYYYSAVDGNEIGSPQCATEFVTTEFGEEICAYYSNEDDWLETPLESNTVGAMFTRDFGDVRWKTDVFFSSNESTAYSTPAPINQLDDSEGPFVDETALAIFGPELENALLDQLYIDPFDTPAGRELWGFQFDARFATPRTIDIETKSWRLVSELSGEIDGWEWVSGITLSRSESEQLASAGVYNRYKYHSAIAGELCADGSIADYNSDTDSLTCVSGSNLLAMYNPFLVGDMANDGILAMTQEMPTRDGESSVYGWDGRVSGELMEWGDDYIRAAFGLELRKEEINDIPSLNAMARAENDYLVDVFGFGSSLSRAKRTQWGAFAEFYVPVTEQLELQLAGRYDHYDDFGGTFNPKVSVSFRPTDTLVLRGSWATSFRAPSLTQAGVKLRTTRASFDCAANQAVADLYCEGFGDLRGNNVLELGNPLLDAEESESFSVGLGFSPTQNTTLTIDYWAFEHEKLVDTDMTAVLDRAITDASLRHCGLVPDGETGISYDPDLCLVTDTQGLTIEENGASLSEILDAWVDFDQPRYNELPLYRDHVLMLQNTGTQEVSGVDLAFEHKIELGDNSISLVADATHYISFERNKPGSDEIEELAGTWRYPENIASVGVFWDSQDYFVGLTANYTSSYEDDIEGMRGRELDELDAIGALNDEGTRDVSSWTKVRLSAGYYFSQATIRLSIDNLFDKAPPLAYGSARGYDSINHDALGRSFNVSVDYRF